MQVTRILDNTALFRGYPAAIRTDQGPEFTSCALNQWTFEHCVDCGLSSRASRLRTDLLRVLTGDL